MQIDSLVRLVDNLLPTVLIIYETALMKREFPSLSGGSSWRKIYLIELFLLFLSLNYTDHPFLPMWIEFVACNTEYPVSRLIFQDPLSLIWN